MARFPLTPATRTLFTLCIIAVLQQLAQSQQELPAASCRSYECPGYQTTSKGRDFEIRRYSGGSVWLSTASVNVNQSFSLSTRAGFLQLFGYVKGNNSESKQIPMTAPVVTDVGSGCDSNFIVSLALSSDVKADPPAPLRTEPLVMRQYSGGWCAAVRSFGGFATDELVAQEAAKLQESLSATRWVPHTRSKCSSSLFAGGKVFSVAQYDSPFEANNRANEIWFAWNVSAANLCD